MKGGKTPFGYTLVEVMVVLAVSGMMFVIASSFINGKQEKTSFVQGVNALSSQIQDVIQQVTDGRYTDIPLACDYNAGPPARLVFSAPAPSQTQGMSPGCVFIGKFMHFSESGAGGVPSQQYEVFSLAGWRSATDITSAAVTAIDPASSPQAPDLTAQENVPQSLDVKKVTVDGVSNFAFGFVQSLGTVNGSSYASGGQSIGLAKTSAGYELAVNKDTTTAITQINSHVMAAGIANICLDDGKQSANIIIGDSNNQLAVNVHMNGAGTC